VRAIEWLKDAVDDYRHWEKMQDKTQQQQQQHQQNESREQVQQQNLHDHQQQKDPSPMLSATSMPYPLTPRKMMALKSSGTSSESPSSSVAHDPHAPPHSPSRINDFEVNIRAFELNLEITVLKFSVTWCSQMLLILHAKIWPFIGTSETGWSASQAGILVYPHNSFAKLSQQLSI
jgi:hypothetical protein